MTLAERLQQAREHAGLEQDELAERVGISQAVVARLENGKLKTTTHTVKIAVVCGVRPEWLDMEQGVMIDRRRVTDERMVRAVKIMWGMPDYAIDDVIQWLEQMDKLIKKAAATAKQ